MSLPYREWPSDEHERWIAMGNNFGDHVKAHVYKYALSKVPSSASPEARATAELAIRDTIYGMMMLLDGIPLLSIRDGAHIQYVLKARIRDGQGTALETIELAPGGDGLCIGFHAWFPGS